MDLRERLLEIDRHLQPAHLVMSEIVMGKNPAVKVVQAAIGDLTRAREMLGDLAEEPTQN